MSSSGARIGANGLFFPIMKSYMGSHNYYLLGNPLKSMSQILRHSQVFMIQTVGSSSDCKYMINVIHTLFLLDQTLSNCQRDVKSTQQYNIDHCFDCIRGQSFRWRYKVTSCIVNDYIWQAELWFTCVQTLLDIVNIANVTFAISNLCLLNHMSNCDWSEEISGSWSYIIKHTWLPYFDIISFVVFSRTDCLRPIMNTLAPSLLKFSAIDLPSPVW